MGGRRATVTWRHAKSFDVIRRHGLIVPKLSQQHYLRRSAAHTRNGFQEFTNSVGGLSPEDGIDARENELKSAAWNLAHALGELLLVQGDHQGHVCDRVLR